MVGVSLSPNLRTHEFFSLPAFWPPGLPAFYFSPSHLLNFSPSFLSDLLIFSPSILSHLYERSTT